MRAQVYGLLAALTATILGGAGFLGGRKTAPTPAPPPAPNYTAAATAGAAALYQVTSLGGSLTAPPQVNLVTTKPNGSSTVNVTLSIAGMRATQWNIVIGADGVVKHFVPYNSGDSR